MEASVVSFVVAPWPSEQALDAVAAYRYKSWELRTPLLQVMEVTSDWIVARLPDWLAPNLISSVGLTPLCVVAAFLPMFQEGEGNIDDTGPPWLLLVAALAMLWQEICDRCDGKQARRLRVGSPLGCMVDHTFDGIASGPVLWCVNMVLQVPPRLILLGQAAAVTGALVQPWGERYKGYFAIYLAFDFVMVLIAVLFGGSIIGGDTMNELLIESPVGLPAVCLRTLVFGVPMVCVVVYHIVSTLVMARQQGLLPLAFGEVLRTLMLIPTTLLWSDHIVLTYTRHISLVLTSLIVMYFLKEVLHAMAHPHYQERLIFDKPAMMVYFAFAACSQFVSDDAVAVIIPCYTAVMVMVAAIYVFGVFGSVQKRLGIVAMFRIQPASANDEELAQTKSQKSGLCEQDTDLDADRSGHTSPPLNISSQTIGHMRDDTDEDTDMVV